MASELERNDAFIFLGLCVASVTIAVVFRLGSSTTSENSWVAIGAIAAALQTLVLVATLVFAGRQVAEARQLRLDQSRPFIVADFELSTISQSVYFEVANVGTVLAHDITIEFDPRPISSFADDDDLFLRFISPGFPTIAPGKSIRTLFDSFPNRGDKRDEGVVIEDDFIVTVNYRDSGNRKYRETYRLSLGQYHNILYLEEKTIHDVAKALEKIDKDLQSMLKGSNRGVRIVTSSDERREAARVRARREEMMRSSRATENVDLATPGPVVGTESPDASSGSMPGQST